MNNNASNVLITSISKKVPLIRDVRRAIEKIGNGARLYGGDLSSDALGKYFVDHFWTMPRTEDSNFAAIREYLREEKIGVVIPTRDAELSFWAAHRDDLARDGVMVMVAGADAIDITFDKLHFAQWGSENGFPVIPTSPDIATLSGERFVVKERYGAGAKHIGLDLSKKDALAHAPELESALFQPFIEGKEYSIDVYADVHGKAKGAVARERLVVVDGESQVTKVVEHPTLEKTCLGIAEALPLRGPAVFQALVTAGGEVFIIECNARFGGASSASIAAGLDSFYWFLREAAGEDISHEPFNKKENLTMVRFKDDIFLS